jgi:hypothetical protein
MTPGFKETSPYSLTEMDDWYLGIWVPRKVPAGEFDKIFTIPPEFNERPDLLSQQEYGTPRLWWVFAVRNPDRLVDPIADFVSGLEIFIPANILQQ